MKSVKSDKTNLLINAHSGRDLLNKPPIYHLIFLYSERLTANAVSICKQINPVSSQL